MADLSSDAMRLIDKNEIPKINFLFAIAGFSTDPKHFFPIDYSLFLAEHHRI